MPFSGSRRLKTRHCTHSFKPVLRLGSPCLMFHVPEPPPFLHRFLLPMLQERARPFDLSFFPAADFFFCGGKSFSCFCWETRRQAFNHQRQQLTWCVCMQGRKRDAQQHIKSVNRMERGDMKTLRNSSRLEGRSAGRLLKFRAAQAENNKCGVAG